MQKEFNITGNCRPAKHYMADVSGKLAQTFKLVEKGAYFIINRPRQYGKTRWYKSPDLYHYPHVSDVHQTNIYASKPGKYTNPLPGKDGSNKSTSNKQSRFSKA
jgi:hypothetical protein